MKVPRNRDRAEVWTDMIRMLLNMEMSASFLAIVKVAMGKLFMFPRQSSDETCTSKDVCFWTG